MMKAATLTLNPALDRTMYFDRPFIAGKLNRCCDTVTTLGSKGINVSRFLKLFGVEATAYGFSGADTGKTMKRMLDGEGVVYDLTETHAPTRMNIKMIDSAGECTEANEKGGPITDEELNNLISRVEKDAEKGKYYFLGGSIPHPVEKGVYNSITQVLKSRGAKVILDCDGEALEKGLEAKPSLIKPNLYELSLLLGKEIKDPDAAIKECKCLYVEKSVEILCTMSEKGAVFAGKEGVFSVTSPRVEMRGFTGAGDSFLAAFTYMRDKTDDIEYSLRFASSAAAAKVELQGSTLPRLEDMDKYIDAVKTTRHM